MKMRLPGLNQDRWVETRMGKVNKRFCVKVLSYRISMHTSTQKPAFSVPGDFRRSPPKLVRQGTLMTFMTLSSYHTLCFSLSAYVLELHLP